MGTAVRLRSLGQHFHPVMSNTYSSVLREDSLILSGFTQRMLSKDCLRFSTSAKIIPNNKKNKFVPKCI